MPSYKHRLGEYVGNHEKFFASNWLIQKLEILIECILSHYVDCQATV